ncbi:MAG TPA: hypothetical protein VMJ32_14180 [Pirellulales bacterium]|nr:hypothetical protein [Pirellulales bacterium]
MRASYLNEIVESLPLHDVEINPSMPTFVTCRIQNCYSFIAHVVLLAPYDHDIWEERVPVEAGQSISIDCPTGFLIISVFDLAKDALCMCRATHVSGSFTLLLS